MGPLSASEAKQIWMERELRSLKSALDRVSIPPILQQSGYWNTGFEGKLQSCLPGMGSVAIGLGSDPDARAQHGGCGDHAPRDRAGQTAAGFQGRDRASQSHGELYGPVRASSLHGVHREQARAQHAFGDHHEQARAQQAFGDHRGQARAQQAFGDPREQARAQQLLGDPREQARTCHLHGDLYEQDRAFDGHGVHHGRDRAPANGACMGLHHNGPQDYCHLPGHGVGGGGCGDGRPGRPFAPWPENSGTTMNTKGELPELPPNSSPLQFGDWLHLIAPSMKDISSVAGWWWENTLREAQCYYAQWKDSTPLQRIRIQPVLPDAIRDHQFQRTEQRGIQMLLKAIPETEQQALVTERALSTTAILFRLLVRFQPGGAGEKQILLQQLTTMSKSSNVPDLAANLRNWRRHFGRAQEVEAVLPDGILLLKALDGPQQQLGQYDPQAAFRLSQSRMQLQLDQQPTHPNLWAFSQCLLAEAETLSLLSSTSTTTVPLKIKQLEGDLKSPGKTTTGDQKSKMSPSVDKPCRFFQSDTGCKAGKTCK